MFADPTGSHSPEEEICNSLLANVANMRAGDEDVLYSELWGTFTAESNKLRYGGIGRTGGANELLRLSGDERSAMCGAWADFFEETAAVQGVACPKHHFYIMDITAVPTNEDSGQHDPPIAISSNDDPVFLWSQFFVNLPGVNRVSPTVHPQPHHYLFTKHPHPSVEAGGDFNSVQAGDLHAYLFREHAVNFLTTEGSEGPRVQIYDPSFGGGPYLNLYLNSSGVPFAPQGPQAGQTNQAFVTQYLQQVSPALTGVFFIQVGPTSLESPWSGSSTLVDLAAYTTVSSIAVEYLWMEQADGAFEIARVTGMNPDTYELDIERNILNTPTVSLSPDASILLLSIGGAADTLLDGINNLDSGVDANGDGSPDPGWRFEFDSGYMDTGAASPSNLAFVWGRADDD